MTSISRFLAAFGLALTLGLPAAAQEQTQAPPPARQDVPAAEQHPADAPAAGGHEPATHAAPRAPAVSGPNPVTEAPKPATVPPASPAMPAPQAVTPAQAQQVLDVLKDDKRRAAFTATLETMTKVLPAAEAKTSPIPLAPDSLGARLLVSVSAFSERASMQVAASAGALRSLPSLAVWAGSLATDPRQLDRLTDTGWRLAVVMLCGLAVEWVIGRLVARPILALATHAPAGRATPATVADPLPDEGEALAEAGQTERMRRRRASPWTMLKRVPFVLGRLILDLLPVIGFGVVAHLVSVSTLGGGMSSRLVLLAMIDAYAVTRVIVCVVRMVFAPRLPRLRLLNMSDENAAYLVRWLRRLVVVAVFGYALAEVGLLFGLSAIAHEALLKTVALVGHIILGVMVIQKRRAVKHWIRAPEGATGIWAAMRNRLAAVWHWIALFYIAALWIVWAVEIRDGYTRMLHAFVFTAAVLVSTRLVLILALGSLDKVLRPAPDAAGYPGAQQRLSSYAPVLRATVYGLVAIAGALLLLQVWGVGALAFLTSNQLGHQLISAASTIGLTLVVALLVWESANTGVERHLARLGLQQQVARSARLRTLLPMLRTALMLVIVVVVALMVLSQIGINIAPLLAGAGVLGIAVGFGSQKLVQDVITGLFLLLENTMQVGDIVVLGGLSGVVENLSIRAIRLRAEDGSVHVIPFSAVTTVTNQTRDYSHAVIEAQVAYDDDYDAVVAAMRQIVREMRAEPRWTGEIQDELEVWGINKFADNAVVIKGRIKCGAFGRWAVGREFNRRMKQRFDQRGGPDAMRMMLPAGAAHAPAPASHVAEPSPEAKLSAEAKKADAQQEESKRVATQRLEHEDTKAAAE